ncbi:CoA transferase [Brevibacterium sp. LE-L]|uniref:CoA transferase n=1 Tax=Brevibacterium sp. LE-L TaxID=3418557 RepID=UPI003CF9550C
MSAAVIRINPLSGNTDAYQWPISDDGKSICWAILNQGKRSATFDFKSEEAQQERDRFRRRGGHVDHESARSGLGETKGLSK